MSRFALLPGLVAALLASSSCLAADNPPKPPDDGPPLDVTIGFIKDTLGHMGKVNFIAYLHDDVSDQQWTNTQSREISNVGRDNTCHLVYHEVYVVDGATLADKDYGIPLDSVIDLIVESAELDMKDSAAKAGHPSWSAVKVDPSVFVLKIRRHGNVFNVFDFSDETLAKRVAKAFTHAVELCHGGNKDPF